MIKGNVRVDLPQKGTICWKHRDHYGSKFRIRSSKCMYPGHIESKRKLTVKPMLLPAVLQTERLFSSAIIKVILPFGASWCTNCMVQLHLSNWKKHSKLLEDVCGVCYQEHDVSRYYFQLHYNSTSCCKLIRAYSRKINWVVVAAQITFRA